MLQELVNRHKPLNKSAKLLILGGGFSGQHIAKLARALGVEVLCSRRQSNTPGADCVFDSHRDLLPAKEVLQGVTHLLSSIPPTAEGEDPVLKHLSKQIRDMPLIWVGYLSTTGVYGDCKGRWVTENDSPKPKQARSIRRLACEKAWEALELPLQIIRLPGIYGPGRSAIENIKKGNVKMINKPGQVFSRIHIDDIAGAIFHLMELSSKGKKPTIINVADNLPTSNLEVLSYAASLMNYSLPSIEPFDNASQQMSPMALSFWEENRKVSNKRLCNDLGYELIHADYQSGLKDCFLHNE